MPSKINQVTNLAQYYTRKSVVNKVHDTVDATLEKIPQKKILSPLLNRAATAVKKQTSEKILKTSLDTDVLIIGAGVSGVLMASKLKKYRPLDSMIIIEKRQDIGGTWDLFKYPGVRSDSEMTTFCFSEHPWYGKDTLAGAHQIKQYLEETVKKTDIEQHIQFGKVVKELSWSSITKHWTVRVQNLADKSIELITARFVVGASGYYDTEKGHQPYFKGQENFTGNIIHPQKWHDNIEYHNKKIVIIGSGATAVTLLPALLDKKLKQQARHVTMLQRSPTYIISVPSSSSFMETLSKSKFISDETAYQINRIRNISIQQGTYQLFTRSPRLAKLVLNTAVKYELRGSDISMEHFSPQYNPWEQRICAVPDGDFFKALKTDHADIVTDEIECFTETGIKLVSGKEITADIIVTATGLSIQMLGGAKMTVDNKSVNIGDKMTYKAVLLEDIPNLAVMFGYTNASWTLKVDLSTTYVVRLLKHMQRENYKKAVAKVGVPTKKNNYVIRDEIISTGSVMDELKDSGYVQRGGKYLPKQGACYPWHVTNRYLSDRKILLKDKLTDDWLHFSQ